MTATPKPDTFALRLAMIDGQLCLTDDAGRRVNNVHELNVESMSGCHEFSVRGIYDPAKHGT